MFDGLTTSKTKLDASRLNIKRRRGEPTRTRTIYQVPGMGTDTFYKVHNNSVDILVRGIMERVFYVKDALGNFILTPKPVPGLISRRLTYFKDLVVKFLPETAPVEPEQFVAYYTGRRRTIYENALESLKYTPLSKKDARLKVFGKAEKTNITVKHDPPVRIVSPRDPRYNIAVGCYLKPLEHLLYRSIGKVFREKTITKGLNAKETAQLIQRKWEKYSDPIAVSLDASRFDQHCSRDILEWEHSVYLGAYRHPKRLQKLLSWQIINDCTAYLPDGKIKYKVEGTRMSGDMNTAAGNCLIMCGLIHAFLKENKFTKMSVVNNGDDSVVIMRRCDHAEFTKQIGPWFKDMGYDMKVEPPVKQLEQISFCQASPVFDGTEYIMVRDPRTSMSKDSFSIKPLNAPSIYQKWVGAVALCGISLTGGIPILQDYYASLHRASHGKVLKNDPTLETGMAMLARGMDRVYQSITWQARVSFWKAFDITPDMQVEIESYFKHHTPEFTEAYKAEYNSVGVPWI